ncbi:DOMON domain-containing protein [bacterium]|nr:DOMON domain-containing protein [bacterium]
MSRFAARLLLLTLSLALLTLTACTTTIVDDDDSHGGWQSESVDGITLRWRTEEGLLQVELTAPTTGWLAVGFDPGTGMLRANIIIGYVQAGIPWLRDDYGDATDSHRADVSAGGSNDILSTNGIEENGSTTLYFWIPLDSGDDRDRLLEAGESYSVILFYGDDDADDFESAPRFTTTTTIEIPE